MSLDNLHRTCYNEDHEAFRSTVRRFVAEYLEPNAAKWDEDGIIPKDVWPKADRIAAEGMKFHRFFTGAPQCVPSRATLMTGRSPVAAIV